MYAISKIRANSGLFTSKICVYDTLNLCLWFDKVSLQYGTVLECQSLVNLLFKKTIYDILSLK